MCDRLSCLVNKLMQMHYSVRSTESVFLQKKIKMGLFMMKLSQSKSVINFASEHENMAREQRFPFVVF